MIVLDKSNNSDKIRLTLSEEGVESETYKLVFTNRGTKEVVTITGLEDVSPYPERYNKFIIDTEAEFEDMPLGFWDYKAYSDDDTLLEQGFMKLNGDGLTYTTRTATTTFKTYNGSN